jgi:hypothetical protein
MRARNFRVVIMPTVGLSEADTGKLSKASDLARALLLSIFRLTISHRRHPASSFHEFSQPRSLTGAFFDERFLFGHRYRRRCYYFIDGEGAMTHLAMRAHDPRRTPSPRTRNCCKKATRILTRGGKRQGKRPLGDEDLGASAGAAQQTLRRLCPFDGLPLL